MVSFLALYRGRSLNEAELVAVSTDVEIVSNFAERLLKQPYEETDPVLMEVKTGKRRALRRVQRGE
jgi:hypothetical protein